MAQKLAFRRLIRIVTLFLSLMILLTTYLTLKEFLNFGLDEISNQKSYFFKILILDVVLISVLAWIVFYRIWQIYINKRKKIPGYIIRYKLTILFGILAALPAIAIAILAGLYIHTVIHGWFNQRVSTAIHASSAVAQAYLKEHQLTILVDATALSQIMEKQMERSYQKAQLTFLSANEIKNQVANEINFTLSQQSVDRKITEAVVIDSSGNTIFRSFQTLIFGQIDIPEDTFEKAAQGQAIVLDNKENDRRVRALIKLPMSIDTLLERTSYLLVGRPIDAEVLNYVSKTKTATDEYNLLEGQRVRTQNTLILLYIIISSLFLLVALWFGMLVAGRISGPIMALIQASHKVSSGNLDVQVQVKNTEDELSLLGNSFNDMTTQIRNQQTNLIVANEELEERRQFIEAIFKGVSAGIISADTEQKITLMNPQAEHLLNIDSKQSIGQKIQDIIPEFKALFEKQAIVDINIQRGDQLRILQCQITEEDVHNEVTGYIITFDDITNLQIAERKAAWSGVARRIAHEIKNPLTPIQLSAERLQRRYSGKIDVDDKVFIPCLQTIIRQVGQIGRLVDEFSSFARLPEPILKKENINILLKDVFILEKQRNKNVTIKLKLPSENIDLHLDSGLITQALTNIIKNASEAAIINKENDPYVHISLQQDNDIWTEIIIEDNGAGFPKHDRSHVLEPYVTTKKEGTGLGLAIVQKIMEDHRGELILSDSNLLKGAKVILRFPKN